MLGLIRKWLRAGNQAGADSEERVPVFTLVRAGSQRAGNGQF